MRIGIFLHPSSIDSYVEQCTAVAEEGFPSVWSPQIFGMETLTAIAVAGREVPGLMFGTAVVPTYPRHPMTMAQMALAANDATKGRLMLGIGLSHQVVIEGMYGMSFDRPAAHMKEYLSILGPLINDRAVSVAGETLTFRGNISVPDAPACPIYIAALAPVMLKLAGTMADGTITWMTGPRTVQDHIIPTMAAAAAAAGRPEPKTMVGLPICVTSDVESARERASKEFAIYGQLPSYRAVLDREGAAGPADIALIGDERTVAASIKRIAEAGATELVSNVFGSKDEQGRTRELLGSLL